MISHKQSSYSLGVIGYPLGHSLSPKLHAAALRASGLHGEYRPYPIPPLPAGQEALEALIFCLRNGDLDGVNVTIPHKQVVIPYLDDLTPLALQIGAVNTIFRSNRELIGDNTDAPGFMADLYKHFPEACNPLSALVLGAGGSARAVVHALTNAGWHILIAARRPEQAHEIIYGCPFGNQRCKAIGLEALPEFIRSLVNIQPKTDDERTTPMQPVLSLIVNTTPVGMNPNKEYSPWPKDLPFPKGAFVYDLVYNPVDTRLICAARSAGLEAANGLGMLIEQAALAFERWTGIHPSTDALRREIAAAVDVPTREEA